MVDTMVVVDAMKEEEVFKNNVEVVNPTITTTTFRSELPRLRQGGRFDVRNSSEPNRSSLNAQRKLCDCIDTRHPECPRDSYMALR